MIKTATFTFHASHNYGSMLQAYALQQVLRREIGVENEIINLRTSAQLHLYRYPTCFPKTKREVLAYVCRLPFLSGLKKKYKLFEYFIQSEMDVSEEFTSAEQLSDYLNKFDCLIAGSDQIWNTACADFDWSYFLPFKNVCKIAYAPSMGPHGGTQVSTDRYNKINKFLNEFKAISVRESGTADVVYKVIGIHPDILVDPTMLLPRDKWNNVVTPYNPIKEKYIFLYCPSYDNGICNLAEKIAKITGLIVVSSNKLPTKVWVKSLVSPSGRMKHSLASGPKEFLRLLLDAEFVISGSFHAVVFSMLFHKPFLAYNGLTDNRMSQILKSAGLEDYSVTESDYLSSLSKMSEIDFSRADAYISEERVKSINFLRKNICL